MQCARKNCSCVLTPGKTYEYDGKEYCCEKCAKECTDERCVCTPCECEK